MSDSSSLPEPADNEGDGSRQPSLGTEEILNVELVDEPLPPLKPSPSPAGMVLAVVIFIGIQVAVAVGFTLIGLLWNVLTEGPRTLESIHGALQDIIGPVVIASLISTFATAICIPIFTYRDQVWRRLAVRGIDPLHLVLALGMVVPLLMVMEQAAEWLVQIRGGANPKTPKEYEVLADLPWYLAFVMACLLPAVGEEAFFRGFLGGGLVGRLHIFPGMVITSLLFGLGHFDSLEHILVTTLLGFCLHAVYLMTKTLAAPVLMHMTNNALGVGLLMLGKAQGAGEVDWKELGDQATVPPLLALTAATALLGLGFLMYETRIRWVLPDGTVWSAGYLSAEMAPASLEARPQRRRAGWVAVVIAGLAAAAFAAALVGTLLQK
jgi:membrane protease YdiL (CAAX protease family)